MDLPPEPQFVSIGGVEVFVARRRPPAWSTYCAQADLVDEAIDPSHDSSTGLLVAGVRVGEGEWPSLVLALSYEPDQGGFSPGLLVVPETQVVFVGAGTALRAYRLSPHVDLVWADETAIGFWGWCQHGTTVVMSAELELAAWDADGSRLWTRHVEPPWSYSVEGDAVTVDVMGVVTTFDLRTGS